MASTPAFFRIIEFLTRSFFSGKEWSGYHNNSGSDSSGCDSSGSATSDKWIGCCIFGFNLAQLSPSSSFRLRFSSYGRASIFLCIFRLSYKSIVRHASYRASCIRYSESFSIPIASLRDFKRSTVRRGMAGFTIHSQGKRVGADT